MEIVKTTLPQNSLLNTAQKEYHFVDSFLGELSDPENKITSVDIGRAFFSGGPKWVGHLFAFRNKIVSIFGLKTAGDMSDRERQFASFICEPGQQLGLFKVFAKTDNEVILGEDDAHLNFRISLFLTEKTSESSKRDFTISTTVAFNNWFGRLYFLPVRPFHNLIVPTILRGIIQELEKRNKDTKSGNSPKE